MDVVNGYSRDFSIHTAEASNHVKLVSNGTVQSTLACVPLNGSIEKSKTGRRGEGGLVEAAFKRNSKTFLCLCICTFYLIYVPPPPPLGFVVLSFYHP